MVPLMGTRPSAHARPFLKWAGGKAKLCPEFEKRGLFPAKFETYHEPFVGAGAVFFHLRPAKAVLTDMNEELIATYIAIRDDVEALIEALSAMKRRHSESYFKEVRKQRPSDLSSIERAARMIYLNRTCFNGLYRVNAKGEFNVPFGRYDNPRIVDAVNLRRVAAALKTTTVEVADFRKVATRAKKGDFVYFDPPYVPLSATSSFTSYTKDAFDGAAQERLATLFEKLTAKGVKALLSNSDTPSVRERYSKFHIESLLVARPINSKADGRGNVGEVVVANWIPKPRSSLKAFGLEASG